MLPEPRDSCSLVHTLRPRRPLSLGVRREMPDNTHLQQYGVYADISRQLTDLERSAVSDALDANVPGSGCVGRHKCPDDNDEVYFSIEAISEENAAELATQYMLCVVQQAGLRATYTLTLQRIPKRKGTNS